MDQFFQLQRQIQDLRQEVSNIGQFAGQLQRSEATNAAQLQAIQQICNRLNQDVSIISNVAQQMGGHMANQPYAAGQSETNTYSSYPVSSQYTGMTGGFAGTGFGGNPSDEFSRNQYLRNLPNQGLPGFLPGNQNLGMMTQSAGAFGATGIGATGYASNPAGNHQLSSAQPATNLNYNQYGTSGFASSPLAGQYSAFGNQNASRYSSF